MIRSCKVVFINQKMELSFYSLKENDPLKHGIVRTVRSLKDDAFCGIQIPKRLIPKVYIRRYNLTNLWKYNLPLGWRLVYTVTADNQFEVICAIIEWFNHKEYEKRFGY